ncbi:hypothetical protein CR513_38625, partial [Mucuna pruriens]
MTMLIKIICLKTLGDAPNLRIISLQEGENDAYMDRETPTLEGLIAKGRSRRIQEERDIQRVNAKVEALSRTREEYRQPSLHGSGGSHEERHYSESSVSSRSQRRERHGRQERYVRNDREERCERNRREREEPRREKLDSGKCKIPPF